MFRKTTLSATVFLIALFLINHAKAQLPAGFYEVDIVGGYNVGALTKKNRSIFQTPQYNINAELPELPELELKTLQDLNEYTYDRTSSRKAELKAQLSQSGLGKVQRAELGAALDAAKQIRLHVTKGKRLAYLRGASAPDHAVAKLTPVTACGMKSYCRRNALLVAEALQYETATYEYLFDRALSANAIAELGNLVSANGKIESADSTRIVVRYTKPTVVAIKYTPVTRYFKSLLSGACN